MYQCMLITDIIYYFWKMKGSYSENSNIFDKIGENRFASEIHYNSHSSQFTQVFKLQIPSLLHKGKSYLPKMHLAQNWPILSTLGFCQSLNKIMLEYSQNLGNKKLVIFTNAFNSISKNIVYGLLSISKIKGFMRIKLFL